MLNVGHAGIAIRDSDDTLVEQSVFDNVYQSGWGYSLWIMERSDRTVFRNNYCVTKGRHSVTTGPSVSGVPVQDFVGDILVENNYFEYTTNDAVNAHETQRGPYRVKGNVFYKCNQGVCLWNGQGEITDNVIIEAAQGVFLDRTYQNGELPTWSGSDIIAGNTMIDIDMDAIRIEHPYFEIRSNIIKGTGSSPGILINNTIDGAVHTSCIIEKNVMELVSMGIQNGNLAGISRVNNWMKQSGNFLKAD